MRRSYVVVYPTLRARTPIGAIRRYPAEWRSSSLSPPQNPYSWLDLAYSWQELWTMQLAHTDLAAASRRSLAWGRSAGGGKKRCVSPLHAAWFIQRSSVSTRWKKISTAAIVNPLVRTLRSALAAPPPGHPIRSATPD